MAGKKRQHWAEAKTGSWTSTPASPASADQALLRWQRGEPMVGVVPLVGVVDRPKQRRSVSMLLQLAESRSARVLQHLIHWTRVDSKPILESLLDGWIHPGNLLPYVSLIAPAWPTDAPPSSFDIPQDFGGDSYTASIAVGLASLTKEHPLIGDFVVSAEVLKDGRLNAVEGIYAKVRGVAAVSGIRRFFLHPDNMAEAARARDDARGTAELDLVEVRTLLELFERLGIPERAQLLPDVLHLTLEKGVGGQFPLRDAWYRTASPTRRQQTCPQAISDVVSSFSVRPARPVLRHVSDLMHAIKRVVDVREEQFVLRLSVDRDDALHPFDADGALSRFKAVVVAPRYEHRLPLDVPDAVHRPVEPSRRDRGNALLITEPVRHIPKHGVCCLFAGPRSKDAAVDECKNFSCAFVLREEREHTLPEWIDRVYASDDEVAFERLLDETRDCPRTAGDWTILWCEGDAPPYVQTPEAAETRPH